MLMVAFWVLLAIAIYVVMVLNVVRNLRSKRRQRFTSLNDEYENAYGSNASWGIEGWSDRWISAGYSSDGDSGGRTSAPPADPVTVEGLTFSDELGDFRLVSVTGKGTLDNPFVVTEEITGPGDPTLVIKNFSDDFGNRVGTQHTAAFAMEKVVTNGTTQAWQGFQMELREIENRPSTGEDGLSFGRASQLADFVQSSMPNSQRVDEPEGSLGFRGDDIPPGGQATFRFIVSDMSPVHRFYLVQRPQPGRS
jgi:hypothetical protein